MKPTELKPCPFCGGEAEVQDCFAQRHLESVTVYRVIAKHKPNCFLAGQELSWYGSKAQAIAGWNTRAKADHGVDIGEKILASFGRKVLEAHRGEDCMVGGIEGGDLQDIAIECGALVEKEVTEPCCNYCTCDDFPTTCYFLAEHLKGTSDED